MGSNKLYELLGQLTKIDQRQIIKCFQDVLLDVKFSRAVKCLTFEYLDFDCFETVDWLGSVATHLLGIS